MFLFLGIISVCFSCVLCLENPIRGLHPANAVSYDPGRDFRCLDGSQIIPFSYVNDDYCDCADGSDEPGTSACPHGSFYCTNHGYTPRMIPSNRVNDGICDCCDGADEYNGRTQCTNLCEQLGQLLKEEEARQHRLKMEGYEIYLQYVEQSREARNSKQARLEQLLRERDEVDVQRAALEKRKTETEQPEREAKERFEQAWEAEKELRKSSRRLQRAKEAFSDLDQNQDYLVSVEELQAHSEFDIDSNGEVAPDEAKEYLEENEAVAFDVFLEKIWDNIREIYRRPGDNTSPPPTTSEAPDTRDDGSSPPDTHIDYDDNKRPTESRKPTSDDDEDDKMPDYDENTKFLISAADEARREYNNFDAKFRDIESEINELKKVLDQDLGLNSEYFPLLQKCFDYTDREYTYSLCPFDRASQRSKSGGVETSLGRWGTWAGPSDFKYAVMKYEHGQNCWNGPDRSAKVHVQCGTTNELVSVTEPNRCEYRYVFNTPAACSQPPEQSDSHPSTHVPPRTEL